MQKVNITEIKTNPNNPRLIKDDKFKKLIKSIKEFPAMLELRPIVVNEHMIVLGGNMRLKACEEAGIEQVPIIFADNLTEEQQKEFIIKDNSSFGEWDWDLLANEWDIDMLNDWGIDVPNFDIDNDIQDEKDLSDQLEQSFKIEIDLESEEEQEKIYNQLIADGYKCRILTL